MGDVNSIGFYGGSCRSSPPEVLLDKGVLRLCSKVTGENPCFATLLKSSFGMGVLL